MRTSGETAIAAHPDEVRPGVLLTRAFARARAGQVTAALADLQQVRQGPWQSFPELDQVAVLTTSIDCHLARGELVPAQALAAALPPYVGAPGVAGGAAHYALGIVAAASGDDDQASRHFAEIGRLVGDGDPDLLPWRAEAALSAVRQGRRAEGVELARAQLALARKRRAPFGTAIGLRTLASVDPLGDGQSQLRQARALLGDLPAARLAAQVDTDLAGLLILSGGGSRHLEALDLLRRAERYAVQEQLWPLQSRIRRLLERLGEHRPLVAEAVASLTAAERRVAGLATAGMTNREIAQQLAVTVKGVERHLSHVYRKLGIRSRSGLLQHLEIQA